MSSTTEEGTAVTRYLDAVRAELADLPDDERIEMLEDVRAHLLEVAAEEDGPLDARLGDPAAYAADLRSAAGLPNRSTNLITPTNGLAARIERSAIIRGLRDTHRSAQKTALYREMRPLLPAVQQSWWLGRAYIATILLGAATTRTFAPPHYSLFPRVLGSRPVGVLVLLILVVASVAWARVAAHRRTLLVIAVLANVWLLYAATNIAERRLAGPRGSEFYGPSSPYTEGIVRGPSGNILNIYPYALDGTPLKDVLLFDQDGRPITGVVMDDYTRQAAATDARDGQLIPNLFPYPEPLRDGRTGTIFGVRPAPAITPPQVMARATPSASAVPVPPVPSPASASAAPSPTP